MRVLGVIPARLGSTRLPNKPLQPLAGEPLITRVIERVLDHGLVGQLVVATDSEKVARVAEISGVRAVLTSSSHSTGTDRVAEVAGRAEFAGFDTIVNIQGDEPFLSREAIPYLREPGDPSDGLYWQHIGIYACTRTALARWVGLPPSPAEQAERLEQLRALHNGISIGVARLAEPALPGVDTAEDLRRAEAHWHAYQGQG
jgi:3-deoxy-manno-octulosonate cytidylyltransferase (CMP-KDO synthetase)